MTTRRLAVSVLLGALCAALPIGLRAEAAELSIEPYFTSHMVIQRGKANPVAGTARPGAKVSVACRGESVAAVAE